MAERRQELKIRTKLCGFKSSITGAERMGTRENKKRQGGTQWWQGDAKWTLNNRWDLGGCPRKKRTGRRKSGRAFVSSVTYSDFSHISAAGLELPSLFLFRVSVKQNSSSLPLQCVEGPSQGWMEVSATWALMLVMYMMSTASGLSELKRER